MNHHADKILTQFNVSRLPSLPHVLVEMLQACQENQASFQSISSIISRDAGIAARVISLANSSFYSRGAKITSLERALLVLGTDTIKTIVITASLQQFFSGFDQTHTQFLKKFWKRSLTCALLSKSLAILTSYPNAEEAYLTGLLHNIGELILETNHPSEFNQLLQNSASDSDRVFEEQQLFQFSHPSIGASLAQNWGLNEFMSDAIHYHHATAEQIQDAHHLVKITYLASLLSEAGASESPHSFEAADQLFELNASLAREILSKIESEVKEVAQSMAIDISSDNAAEDQLKQVSLAKHVRNIGLLQTAAGELSKANSKLELTQAFENTLDLLFGFTHSAVFWFEPESQELIFDFHDKDSNSPIKFKLDQERSLIAKSALSNTIISSKNEAENKSELSIIDQQMIRHLGAAGLICIPIKSGDLLHCVLVSGCNQNVLVSQNQHQLLTYFANEIAKTCNNTLSQIQIQEHESNQDEIALRISEIAHEANNPLNIIGNYLVNLSNKLDGEHAAQDDIQILREELERTSTILLRLKDIHSQDDSNDTFCDINGEIDRLVKLYKGSLFLANHIRCEQTLDSNLKPININRNAFRQILTNLMKNAVEALDDNGNLKIATQSSVNVNGSQYIEITIQDNGPGMPADILNNLFKPVTSTKGSGHSGLGLSITKNLVTEAKGTISCRSSKQGTEIQILFPSKDV